MDAIWHAAILDTQLYDKIQDMAKVKIHHRPEGAEEGERLRKRVKLTKDMYVMKFEESPLEENEALRKSSRKNPTTITVKHLMGKTFTLDPSDSVQSLRQVVQEKVAISPARQKLIYAGKLLEDGRTLADYNIGKESTIYVGFRYVPGEKANEV